MLVRIRVRSVPELLTAALCGLVAVNRVLLRTGGFPRLYESGVRYVREPRGSEDWQTVERALKSGRADCEDLACWRAAELQLRGEAARAEVIKSGRAKYHALVRRGDGTIEDPSIVLGMKKGR